MIHHRNFTKELQRDIRFARTPFLQNKAPVKLVYAYSSNNRANMLQRAENIRSNNVNTHIILPNGFSFKMYQINAQTI